MNSNPNNQNDEIMIAFVLGVIFGILVFGAGIMVGRFVI